MPRWSKLQKELYLITDPAINFQIHCCVYRMCSRWGTADLPRYWITLGKEIIFDYPKQFINEDGELKNDGRQMAALHLNIMQLPKITHTRKEIKNESVKNQYTESVAVNRGAAV